MKQGMTGLAAVTALLCGAAAMAGAALGGPASPALANSAGTATVPPSPDACAKLAQAELAGVTIDSARLEAAEAPVPGITLYDLTGKSPEGLPVTGLPAFCRVAGHLQPEQGSHISFEVWLPSEGWDGRLHGVGIGGFAGYIDYLALSLAVRGGQVGVATDTGHKKSVNLDTEDSSWAKGHPGLVQDYGWRAIHLSTVAAKQVIRAFYGRSQERSYFVGCSGGGRQGLIEASRFPEDYDGIVAGAPAANFTDLAMSMIGTIQPQLPPGAAIRPEQAALVQQEVVGQCDALDGVKDGLIDDPRLCKPDVAKMTCGMSNSPLCLSAPQAAALRKIYAGPRDAAGRLVVSAYVPAGSEVSKPSAWGGWDSYIFRTAPAAAVNQTLAGGLLQDLVQQTFATTETFDFNRDPARLKAALAGDLDASPNLQRFFARGGKVILWHGWADAAIPPEATLAYHDAMLRQSGSAATASSRLFMIPGVQHCMGGTGPDSFGQVSAPQAGDTPDNSLVAALQTWVEHGHQPQALVAHLGFNGVYGIPRQAPERQRLLCAWPAKPVLRAGGDPDKAADYSCTGTSAPYRASSRR